jgi:hypothetical protein
VLSFTAVTALLFIYNMRMTRQRRDKLKYIPVVTVSYLVPGPATTLIIGWMGS